MKTKICSLILPGLLLLGVSMAGHAQNTPGYNNKIPEGILTPDSVETSIGTLKFFDGAPYAETAEKVYDYLDTMRGVDTFLKGMPGASLDALIKGIDLRQIDGFQLPVPDGQYLHHVCPTHSRPGT